MNRKADDVPGIETLLELNDEVFPMENGYWTKFEARRVCPSEKIPHGIRYSLTLHDRNGRRVLGFDNAHSLKSKKKKFKAKKLTWDHKHANGITEDYEFESAGQLLEDFWTAVDEIIR